MAPLPVAHRELRVLARRWSTHLIRPLAVFMPMVLMAFFFESFRSPEVTAQGRILFLALSTVAFVNCVAIGLVATDTISEERRNGTLGLLFLSGLRGYEVIAGKLVSRSVLAVSWVVAGIPVLIVPLMLGGVTLPVATAMLVLLASTMLVSLAVSMLCSVLTARPLHSLAAAVLVLVLWLGVPVLLLNVPDQLFGAPSWLLGPSSQMRLLSPLQTLVDLGETLFQARPLPARVWPSLLLQQMLAWGGLVASGVLLSSTWRGSLAAGAPPRSPAGRRKKPITTRPLTDDDPFRWLALRRAGGFHFLWIASAFLGSVVGGWLVKDWFQLGLPAMCLVMGFIAGGILKAHLVGACVRFFTQLREDENLEVLLVTPGQPHRLFAGSQAAWGEAVRLPGLLVGILTLLVVFLAEQWSAPNEASLLPAAGVWLIVSVVDCRAMAQVSTWLGLFCRRWEIGLSLTLALLVACPWALTLVACMNFLVLITPSSFTFLHGVGIWAVMSLMLDAAFAWVARDGLTRQLTYVRNGS